MITNFVIYQWELMKLVLTREISLQKWPQAARRMDTVVCGRHGIFVVDVAPEAGSLPFTYRAMFQLVIGLLMVAGAIGHLAFVIEYQGVLGLIESEALWSFALALFGLVFAIDATVEVSRHAYLDASAWPEDDEHTKGEKHADHA